MMEAKKIVSHQLILTNGTKIQLPKKRKELVQICSKIFKASIRGCHDFKNVVEFTVSKKKKFGILKKIKL